MIPIALEADIHVITDDYGGKVVFRGEIDESEPETIFISITRERWDKWGRPTKVPVVLFDVPE